MKRWLIASNVVSEALGVSKKQEQARRSLSASKHNIRSEDDLSSLTSVQDEVFESAAETTMSSNEEEQQVVTMEAEAHSMKRAASQSPTGGMEAKAAKAEDDKLEDSSDDEGRGERSKMMTVAQYERLLAEIAELHAKHAKADATAATHGACIAANQVNIASLSQTFSADQHKNLDNMQDMCDRLKQLEDAENNFWTEINELKKKQTHFYENEIVALNDRIEGLRLAQEDSKQTMTALQEAIKGSVPFPEFNYQKKYNSAIYIAGIVKLRAAASYNRQADPMFILSDIMQHAKCYYLHDHIQLIWGNKKNRLEIDTAIIYFRSLHLKNEGERLLKNFLMEEKMSGFSLRDAFPAEKLREVRYLNSRGMEMKTNGVISRFKVINFKNEPQLHIVRRNESRYVDITADVYDRYMETEDSSAAATANPLTDHNTYQRNVTLSAEMQVQEGGVPAGVAAAAASGLHLHQGNQQVSHLRPLTGQPPAAPNQQGSGLHLPPAAVSTVPVTGYGNAPTVGIIPVSGYGKTAANIAAHEAGRANALEAVKRSTVPIGETAAGSSVMISDSTPPPAATADPQGFPTLQEANKPLAQREKKRPVPAVQQPSKNEREQSGFFRNEKNRNIWQQQGKDMFKKKEYDADFNPKFIGGRKGKNTLAGYM
jgi:hypothetical protein